jgi:hypothetical protein
VEDLKAVQAAIDYSTQPRVNFFDDPGVERVLGITMAVAQEVGQVLERLDTLERLLVAGGALQPGAVQAYVPAPEVAAQRLSMQEAFIARLLRVVEQEIVALRAEQARTGGGTGTAATPGTGTPRRAAGAA